jgi:thioesterase domain-containing protein/acyl carrier protein
MKNVADIYALSPMQQLMLLHVKTKDAAHDVLFNQIVYRIRGPLDRAAYRAAWQLMIDRHPALRTMFVWQDGKEPLQIVRETLDLPWAEEDWRAVAPADQEVALEKFLCEDRREGFDMLHPPLMRLNLIRLDEDEYRLVWSSHHLVIDRWCIGTLFNEVKTAYEAALAGTRPQLPPAPRYRDYIAFLAGRDSDEARAFWEEVLSDLAARQLPLRAQKREAEPALEQQRIPLDRADVQALRQFAAGNAITLGTAVTGAWAMILSVATNADDVLFGQTVSGRPAELPDVQNAVGCFINNVPLRIRLPEDADLGQWLREVRDQQLALQPFEYVSPAQIQSWSGAKASGPLFDSLVVLQAPISQAMPEGLEIKFQRGGMQTGYPISLGVVPGKESLNLTLTFDPDQAPPALVHEMGVALARILKAMPGESRLQSLRNLLELNIPGQVQVEEAARQESGDRPYIAPRTPAEAALIQMWAEVLNLPRVGLDDKFFELGGDSISAARLLTLVEERGGKRVPISLFFHDPTVAEMAEAMGDESQDLNTNPLLLPVNKEGTRPPFFYAHGVFGDIASLNYVIPNFDREQPVYGIQALGLNPDLEPDRTIEQMAERYVNAIQDVQPNGPYYLGGFCFGGVLAFEMARQLEELGEQIALLAIIEGAAPRQFHNQVSLLDPQRIQIAIHTAAYWARGYEDFGGRRLGNRLQSRFPGQGPNNEFLNDEAELEVEFDNMADFYATRPQIQYRLREINNEAIEAYIPRPINGRVTLIRARYLHLGHAFFGEIDPERGWGSLARGGVTIRYVDGTHIGVLKPPYAAQLAVELQKALNEAASQNP